MDGETPAQRLWSAALALNRAAARVDPRAGRLPPLLFLTDPEGTPEPWRVSARLPAGSGVIHRGFGRPEARDVAMRLRQATRAAGVRLLIAADADLAEAVWADGVHLPERDLGRAAELRARRPDWLLTGAVHSPSDPVLTDLDAVLVSPVFAAHGPSGARPALGVDGIGHAVRTLGVPAYALGGVDAAGAEALLGSGACGIAAIRAIVEAWSD